MSLHRVTDVTLSPMQPVEQTNGLHTEHQRHRPHVRRRVCRLLRQEGVQAPRHRRTQPVHGRRMSPLRGALLPVSGHNLPVAGSRDRKRDAEQRSYA